MGTLKVPVTARDHIRGAADAPVILVGYADFQCPYSAQAYLSLKALAREAGDMLAIVFRHFPHATTHPFAELAAEAAEAAAAQGCFWEMHDMLFENQEALARADLLDYATRLGLESAQFTQDLSEHRHESKVHDDFMGGVRSGVDGTPGLFINGVRHRASYEAASLLAAVVHAGGNAEPRRAPHIQPRARQVTRHR